MTEREKINITWTSNRVVAIRSADRESEGAPIEDASVVAVHVGNREALREVLVDPSIRRALILQLSRDSRRRGKDGLSVKQRIAANWFVNEAIGFDKEVRRQRRLAQGI